MLRPVVESFDAGVDWNVPFHVEIDTGMGRTGIRWDDAATLRRFERHRPEGVFTHLCAADESPGTITIQYERFRSALRTLGSRPQLLHVANREVGVWRSISI